MKFLGKRRTIPFKDTLIPKFLVDNLHSMVTQKNKFLFLVDNIYVRFGGQLFRQLFRQMVGIPMGTNCAPLLAALQHYYRRFVTLIARRCKVKFFRNWFAFIFANIFNNDVDRQERGLYCVGGRCFSNWG